MGTSQDQIREDIALAKALAWRDELRRNIADLQAQAESIEKELDRRRSALRHVEGFISDWRNYAESDLPSLALTVEADAAPPPPAAEKSDAPKRRKATGNSKKEEVAETARDLIQARGEPIGREELLRLLTQERGLTIQGTNPLVVLSTMLWRMSDRVVRLKKGGYWLTELPYEPAGYDPDLEALGGDATDHDPPDGSEEYEDEEPGN